MWLMAALLDNACLGEEGVWASVCRRLQSFPSCFIIDIFHHSWNFGKQEHPSLLNTVEYFQHNRQNLRPLHGHQMPPDIPQDTLSPRLLIASPLPNSWLHTSASRFFFSLGNFFGLSLLYRWPWPLLSFYCSGAPCEGVTHSLAKGHFPLQLWPQVSLTCLPPSLIPPLILQTFIVCLVCLVIILGTEVTTTNKSLPSLQQQSVEETEK